MICPSCGLRNPSTSTVCASCQASLVSTTAASVPIPIPSVPAQATLPLMPTPPTAAADSGSPSSWGDEASEKPRAPADSPIPMSLPAPAPAAARVYAPVPGPVDRESFFAAQHRYRRQTWRLVAVCALAAIVTGIPLSLVLTPIIFATILIVTRLIQIVTPVPDVVWNAYERVGLVLVRAIEAIDESSASSSVGSSGGTLDRIPWQAVLSLAAVWLVPGVVLMLILWPVLGLLFRHAGGSGVLLSLGARAPRGGDLEEQQLVNVVEELAIAAGILPPRVMLVDAPAANAAVVGSSPEDAVIVVTRPLLDDLERDETQGVLAHLVASIGNGDLRAALSLIAVFQTFGFASALIRLPIDGAARRTVWRMLRYVFGRHRPRERAEEARAVSDMLTGGLEDFGENDDFDWVSQPPEPPRQRPGPPLGLLLYLPFTAVALFVALVILEASSNEIRLAMFGLAGLALLLIWYQRVYAVWTVRQGVAWARVMIMLPYYLGGMMPLLMLMMLKSFLLGPLIGLLWRTRRYLADATAVQLTRDPDSLASGLSELARRGGVIPGGAWAAPLFIVGAETTNVRITADYQKQTSRQRPGEALTDSPEGKIGSGGAKYQRDFGGSTTGSSMPLHPSLPKRLEKLRRLGATPAVAPAGPFVGIRRPAPSLRSRLFIWFVIGPLMALVPILMLVALALMAGLALFFTSIMMVLVYGLFLLVAPA